MPSATLEPTPCTVCSRRNHSRSASRAEAEQADGVLAHLRLDGQHGRLAGRRQGGQRLGRAQHDIADAVHVEDHVVLAIAVDDALELADHARLASALLRPGRPSLRPRPVPIADSPSIDAGPIRLRAVLARLPLAVDGGRSRSRCRRCPCTCDATKGAGASSTAQGCGAAAPPSCRSAPRICAMQPGGVLDGGATCRGPAPWRSSRSARPCAVSRLVGVPGGRDVVLRPLEHRPAPGSRRRSRATACWRGRDGRAACRAPAPRGRAGTGCRSPCRPPAPSVTSRPNGMLRG